MLDLWRLEILHRFAYHGSITATALDLGYSPSAISQQLATLEREAGVALIERTAHSANLTDAGRELVEHAGVVLAAVETAQSRMRARAETIGGHVVVSCIPGLAATLAPHLAALQRRHPDLTIVAHETGSARAAAAVLEGISDLAVVDDWAQEPAPPATGLAVYRLRRESIVLAVPAEHPLARQPGPVSGARLRDIVAAETWLSAPAGELSRTAGDLRLAAAGAVPDPRWEFEGLHVLAALVAAGSGVALVPAGIADEQSGVAALPLRPRMYRQVFVITRSTIRENPAIESCLDAARAAFDTRT